jgi:hypothetical protein
MTWKCEAVTSKGLIFDKKCGMENDDSLAVCTLCLKPTARTVTIAVKVKGNAVKHAEFMSKFTGFEFVWKFKLVTESIDAGGKAVKGLSQVAPVQSAINSTGFKFSSESSSKRAPGSPVSHLAELKGHVESLFPAISTARILDDALLELIAEEAGQVILDAAARAVPILKEIIAIKNVVNNAATIAEKLANLYNISAATHIANTDNYIAVQGALVKWLKEQIAIDTAKIFNEIYNLACPGTTISAPVKSAIEVLLWLAGVAYEGLKKKKMNEVLAKPLSKEVLLKYPLIAAELFCVTDTSDFIGVWGDGLGETSQKVIMESYNQLQLKDLDEVANEIRSKSRIQIRLKDAAAASA